MCKKYLKNQMRKSIELDIYLCLVWPLVQKNLKFFFDDNIKVYFLSSLSQ